MSIEMILVGIILFSGVAAWSKNLA